jgi:hypothetical protein
VDFLLSLKREGTRRVPHEISGKSGSPNWPKAMGDEKETMEQERRETQ